MTLPGRLCNKKPRLNSKDLGLKIYCVWLWNAYTPSKSSCSMSVICIAGSRVNFSSNSRLLIHSNKMDRVLQTPRQHWSTMLFKKTKEDNKKTMLEDVGVTKLTQELVALRGKVWVLIPTSLMLMVWRSMQHHNSTGSRLTRPSRLTAKPWMVQH